MYSRTNLISIMIAVAALVAMNSATAALLERDWKVAGDGLITHDIDTGLEWLDLTETTNLTVATVTAQLGPGGDFEGFRYATAVEVGQLYTNAGLSGFATAVNTVLGDSNGVQSAAALQALWGTTYPQPEFSQVTSGGFIDELVPGTGFVYRLTSLTVRTGPTVTDFWSAGTRGSASGGASPRVGSALVRASAETVLPIGVSR